MVLNQAGNDAPAEEEVIFPDPIDPDTTNPAVKDPDVVPRRDDEIDPVEEIDVDEDIDPRPDSDLPEPDQPDRDISNRSADR
jgi:hypothetical protein